MIIRVENRRLFIGLLATLIVLAWMGLWFWGQSPYGRFLDHTQLSELSGDDAGLLAFFVAGWTLMVFAMMLPSSLPLISLFQTMTRHRADHQLLVGLLIAGYVGVWAWFGVAVHLGDLALHRVTEQITQQITQQIPWLSGNYWVLGAAVLVLAGAYQFTPLKYHCLDQCRSPLSFIISRWTGRRERIQALRLGLQHGVFCVGCCWSLMLLMFAVGSGNIGWMLLLGAVMSIEKNLPWGRRLSKPLGLVLIIWGLALGVNGQLALL